jgi:hypothetical protein
MFPSLLKLLSFTVQIDIVEGLWNGLIPPSVTHTGVAVLRRNEDLSNPGVCHRRGE